MRIQNVLPFQWTLSIHSNSAVFIVVRCWAKFCLFVLLKVICDVISAFLVHEYSCVSCEKKKNSHSTNHWIDRKKFMHINTNEETVSLRIVAQCTRRSLLFNEIKRWFIPSRLFLARKKGERRQSIWIRVVNCLDGCARKKSILRRSVTSSVDGRSQVKFKCQKDLLFTQFLRSNIKLISAMAMTDD